MPHSLHSYPGREAKTTRPGTEELESLHGPKGLQGLAEEDHLALDVADERRAPAVSKPEKKRKEFPHSTIVEWRAI